MNNPSCFYVYMKKPGMAKFGTLLQIAFACGGSVENAKVKSLVGIIRNADNKAKITPEQWANNFFVSCPFVQGWALVTVPVEYREWAFTKCLETFDCVQGTIED